MNEKYYLELDDIIYSIQKFGGASTYWFELTKRLIEIIPEDINRISSGALSRLFSPKSKANVFHSSHFRISRSPGVKNVVTIHDLIYERGLAGGRGRIVNLYERKKAVDRADAIICISESTKRDLLSYYQSASSKPIHVIHHGASSLPRSSQGIRALDSIAAKYGLNFDEGKFFLFVGGRGGYKNFEFFLHAFAIGGFEREGYKIICTGSSLTQEEETLIAKLKLQGSVISVGLLEFSLLGELYAVARALVYPSLYEGFGLPPLEAMASGCPVICSATSSLPEVVGDAGILIEPMSQESLLQALQSVLDHKKRSSLIASGRLRAQSFSWDKTALQHVDVYRSVAPF